MSMYEWNEEEKRIDFSHKPVLHGRTWRSRISSRSTPARPRDDLVDQGDSNTTSSVTAVELLLRRHPQSPSRRHAQKRLPSPVTATIRWSRNSAACCARPFARGAAARRDCARHRPHRPCCSAGEENLREVRALSDEPARRGFDDGGAPVGTSRPKQLRELHIRLGAAGEERFDCAGRDHSRSRSPAALGKCDKIATPPIS